MMLSTVAFEMHGVVQQLVILFRVSAGIRFVATSLK